MSSHPSSINAIAATRVNRYDAVIVGARAAGAATAMLLAQRGLRVLAVDRSGYGTDTLSTHALMRGAVSRLEAWGLAADLRAQTSSVTSTVFHYDDQVIELDASQGGASPLMAPRRTILDRTLVDAAANAGAEIRHNTSLTSITTHPSGRVVGVELEYADADTGRTVTRRVATDLLIGADGINSTVARRLEVPVTHQGTEASAYVARYLDGLDIDRSAYHWLYQQDRGAGFIPTGHNQHVVFAAMPRHRFRSEIRHDVTAGFDRVLGEVNPEFAEAVRAADTSGPVRSWPGRPGHFRQAYGPGWALVGDAGYFKDPFAAHGISDAFRDAELLADAVTSGDFESYRQQRDELSMPLFEALEDIASYRWTLGDLPAVHQRLGKAMANEHRAFTERERPGSHLADAA